MTTTNSPTRKKSQIAQINIHHPKQDIENLRNSSTQKQMNLHKNKFPLNRIISTQISYEIHFKNKL